MSDQWRINQENELSEIVTKLGSLADRLDEVDGEFRSQFNVLGERIVTKDEQRRRRLQMLLVSLIVAAASFVIEHGAITKCFLTPAQTGWSKTTCSAIFPGYEKARTQSERNLSGLVSTSDRLASL